MDREELCGHLDHIRQDMRMAYEFKDWAAVDRAYSKLAELTGRLWKADDFTIETGIGR